MAGFNNQIPLRHSMQRTIQFEASEFTNSKGYVDIARALSQVNRKHYDQVNGKGVAQTYICEIELVGASRVAAFYTAPETWTVKNAIKRLHIARADSLRKAGTDLRALPAYSRNLKMYLSAGHRATGTMLPSLFTPSTDNQTSPFQGLNQAGGSWLYTRLAHAAGIEGGTLGDDFGDDYELHLMGSHVFTSSTGTYQTYESVAVVEAYLQHRRNKTVNIASSTGDVVQEEPNPLALLMNDSGSAQEKAEIISQAQAVDPPYETASGAWAGRDPLDMVQAGALQTSAQAIRDRDVIRVPAGLLAITLDNASQCTVKIHVEGMEDMEG